jgi:Flp pilus assembly protein TadG
MADSFKKRSARSLTSHPEPSHNCGEEAGRTGKRSGSIWRPGRRGNSIIEFSLIAPWFVFLFIGAFDFGFYVYSLNATQTAARQGALYCSTSITAQCADATSSTQCGYVLSQLRMLPNVGGGVITCNTSTSVTASAPVAVVTTSPLAAGNSPDGLANSSVGVTVVYLTPRLIPIPGLLPGQLTITRTVKMKFRA